MLKVAFAFFMCHSINFEAEVEHLNIKKSQ